MQERRSPRSNGCGCTPILFVTIIVLAAVYFFAPLRTNILLLGIDHAPPENSVARSDTIILGTVFPMEPYIGLLSVPRDLWVNVPGIGENRVNTAHYFAEANEGGSGPRATLQMIDSVFGVPINYYIRIRFEGFRAVVNALGGVEIELETGMAGYPAGTHYLTGNKALAFARSRMGSDDFFRMEQGQLLLKAILKKMVSPVGMVRVPAMLVALAQNLDTNLPWWQWPRLVLAVIRAGPDGIDNRIISREMVTPFVTTEGASVLLPDWNQINPLLAEMFGR